MADLFSCRATAVLQKASAEQSGLSADVDLRLKEDQGRFSLEGAFGQ